MKTLLVAAAIAASAIPAFAQEQDHAGPPPSRERVERIERLKQMQMIEALDLGEEDAVRFMAKRKEHEDRMRSLVAGRNDLLDGIQDQVGPMPRSRADGRKAPKEEAGADVKDRQQGDAKADLPAIERALAQVLEQDRKIFDERKRYQDDLRRMLGTEKFAKMLLFEREFQMQVRDAMGKYRSRRSQKFDE